MTVLQLMAVLSKLPRDKQVIIRVCDTFGDLVANVDEVSMERTHNYLSDYEQSRLHIDGDYVVVLSGDELVESEE